MSSESSNTSTETRLSRLIRKTLIVLIAIPILYALIYVLLDSRGISIPLLMLFFLLPILIFILNYFKKYTTSKIIGLFGYNICLFLVASSEPNDTGVQLHFITCSAVAIILFPYSERWKSFLFIAFSLSLLLVANLYKVSLLPFRELSNDVTKMLFIAHTIGACIISNFCIFMLLGKNYSARTRLIQNREIIESKNRELVKINEELDRFVYSASHDLKAPLSNIKGLVTLMEIDKDTSQQEFILRIKKQIETMSSFIQDIVDYSRNSRVDLKLEWINLHELINDIHHSFLYFENAGSIKFENNVHPKQLVYSDQYRLRVILNNIISNAFKYADLSKNESFIKISCQKTTGEHQVIIEDNGRGIAKEHLPKVFDMFFRASSVSKGSGLGLYIAMESARKINCSLEVQSVHGQGTIFTLSLPQQQMAETT
jgi:signal transduction histidine kinase